MALMMQKTSFVARPQPRVAWAPLATPARALALGGDRPLVQRLLDSLLGKAADPAPADADDDIPPEYRQGAAYAPHGSGWVHSHIADRLVNAGREDAH